MGIFHPFKFNTAKGNQSLVFILCMFPFQAVAIQFHDFPQFYANILINSGMEKCVNCNQTHFKLMQFTLIWSNALQ